MKKVNRILTLVLIICMFGINVMPVLADNYKLKVEKESADIKYLENGHGYISKKIINSDLENGEITIKLTVNNSKKSDNITSYANTEVYVIIPNTNNTEEFQKYITSLKQLGSKLLSNSNVKLGVIQIVGPNDPVTVGKTFNDAKIAVELTDDLSKFNLNVDKMTITSTSEYAFNNVQSALYFANYNYSTNVNKFLIIPDIVPDVAAGIKAQIQYGGWTGLTAEQSARNYVSSTVTETKNTLDNVSNNNVNIVMLRPNNKVYNMAFYDEGTDNLATEFDGTEYVNQLYGTIENPTYGVAYDSNSVDVYTFISEKVSEEVLSQIPGGIKNVTITDYFPDDIKDNFEFSYVSKPTKGTISEKISDNNTITYTLNELKENESVVISYKLKLKSDSSSDLVNKVINTNEKVVLNYTDSDSAKKEVILTSSPSIKIEKEEIKEEEKQPEKEEVKEEVKDVEETVENPPTGLYISLGMLGMLVVGISGYLFLQKKNYFNKI